MVVERFLSFPAHEESDEANRGFPFSPGLCRLGFNGQPTSDGLQPNGFLLLVKASVHEKDFPCLFQRPARNDPFGQLDGKKEPHKSGRKIFAAMRSMWST